jgi:septum site-determining protein MinC
VQLAPTELTEMLEVAQAVAEFSDEPTQNKAPIALAPTPEIPAPTEGTRLVIGPVRSGVILEHEGHLFVFGDVNPGAEVRATGNIIVLGRLRGTAHAAIGQDVGFILALRLEPQQLRIGRKVTRAGEDAAPPTDSEIAYIAGDAIVVERYLGKLPRNLATSI